MIGTVSIDGTKIHANASKIRSVRYDQAKQLRPKLAAAIAEMTAKAETADAADVGPPAPPAEIARRAALQARFAEGHAPAVHMTHASRDPTHQQKTRTGQAANPDYSPSWSPR